MLAQFDAKVFFSASGPKTFETSELTLRFQTAVPAGLRMPEECLSEVLVVGARVEHAQRALRLDAGGRAPVISRQQPIPGEEHRDTAELEMEPRMESLSLDSLPVVGGFEMAPQPKIKVKRTLRLDAHPKEF